MLFSDFFCGHKWKDRMPYVPGMPASSLLFVTCPNSCRHSHLMSQTNPSTENTNVNRVIAGISLWCFVRPPVEISLSAQICLLNKSDNLFIYHVNLISGLIYLLRVYQGLTTFSSSASWQL